MINRCIATARNTYPSLVYSKNSLLVKTHVPIRTFFSKRNSDSRINRENPEDINHLTGIDDPNFSDLFLQALLKPDFKKSYYNFSTELKKLYSEVQKHRKEAYNFRIDDEDGRVDVIFTFENEEDIKNFSVASDSSFSQGYSSASLKSTQEGTALFTGNICTEVPRDGQANVAGYANMSSIVQMKSFYRKKFFDWSNYTHVVFKVRGDGRTYVVLISIYTGFEETKYYLYAHPLYTRGGPYWQIAKIPISHFYSVTRGKILLQQNRVKNLSKIMKLGLTVSGIDGPFKLELDYIGLEKDKFHKPTCPYEMYKN